MRQLRLRRDAAGRDRRPAADVGGQPASGFTSGPWKAVTDPRDKHRHFGTVYGADGFRVASCCDTREPGEGWANAHLIAASPDLLRALDYLLEQTVDMDRKYGIGLSEGEEDARHQALAAIAKAHGETYERNQEEG